jgi:hypothetical protein
MIIKLYASLIFLLFANTSIAAAVYDDYESYYQTRHKPVFNIKNQLELSNSTWSGLSYKKYKSIDFNTKYIAINGTRIPLSKAHIFDNEQADTTPDLVPDYLYFSKNYLCIEAVYPSASGTAARHKSVYLIETKKLNAKKLVLYKLPSLFGSCLGVRLTSNNLISFDKISYLYESADKPTGVIFEEQIIHHHEFTLSNKKVVAKFLIPDNVYKFEIEK